MVTYYFYNLTLDERNTKRVHREEVYADNFHLLSDEDKKRIFRNLISKYDNWTSDHLLEACSDCCYGSYYYRDGKLSDNKNDVKSDKKENVIIKRCTCRDGTCRRCEQVEDKKSTHYYLYNVSLKGVSNTGYELHIIDLHCMEKEDINNTFRKVISLNEHWKENHIIRATPDNDKYDILFYRNGKVTPDIEELLYEESMLGDASLLNESKEKTHYSFIKVDSDGHIGVNDFWLPENKTSIVDDFHLKSNKDKLFDFHFILVLNEWTRDDDIRAIPSDPTKPTITYSEIDKLFS